MIMGKFDQKFSAVATNCHCQTHGKWHNAVDHDLNFFFVLNTIFSISPCLTGLDAGDTSSLHVACQTRVYNTKPAVKKNMARRVGTLRRRPFSSPSSVRRVFDLRYTVTTAVLCIPSVCPLKFEIRIRDRSSTARAADRRRSSLSYFLSIAER